MNITDVKVRIFAGDTMKGVASVTFANSFVVHDIKIINGKNGLFIAMPSRKIGEGDFKDIAHPINAEARQELQTLILNKYEETLKEQPEINE